MKKCKEPINKISRPKSTRVFQRERLFRMLDKSREHPIIWVSGPGGSGKTTLVTSYLENQNIDCIWYQIDARDADPATFFYYLSLAVKQATPRKRKSFPLLTPEYMLGLDTFALRYFEAIYQRLKAPIALVIDNYQYITSESILHSLILKGLSIIPDSMTVILISRENPPPDFSRMLANQILIHIGWHQLQLTQEEAMGIARLHSDHLTRDTIRHLHGVTDGWAAGLMLMLTQTNLESMDWRRIKDFNAQEIFHYFSKEVFEREPPEIRDFLLRAALLPHMTVHMAIKLTNYTNAGQILSALNQSNRFTERRYKKRFSYQFHPLFRKFLLSQTQERFTENELTALRREAATLLLDEGDTEEAVILLKDAGAWDLLTDLIVNNAPALLQQGRNLPLLEWLEFIPKSLIAQIPWLEYWMGTALLPFDPISGRKYLEKAFDAFRVKKDATGLFLSWSGVVESILYEMKDISPINHWISIFEDLAAEYKEFPNTEIEGQVVSLLSSVLGRHQMHHHSIPYWIDRALSLLEGSLDHNIKLSLTNSVVLYYLLTGDYSKANRIIDQLGPSALSFHIESNTTMENLFFVTILSFYYCNVGMHTRCLEVVSKGLEFSKRTGVSIMDNLIASYGAWSAIIHEEYHVARVLFEKHSASMAHATPFHRIVVEFARSLEMISLGDLKQGAAHAASSLQASHDVGIQFATIFSHLLNARVMHEMEKPNEAAKHINEAKHISELTNARHLTFHVLMLEARFALDQGKKEAGLFLLRKALCLGREIQLYHNVIDSRAAVTRLCVIALEHGIEEEYVTTYICKCGLVPDTPPFHLDNWPWPLKIFTLGRFSIVKDGVPIRFSTKAQKKPLEMLKVLIALGGRNVNKAQINDTLWPDAEGDKAEQAFATTLHRLRHLLGNDHTVEIQDGKLNLNPIYCWVDSWVFERLLSQSAEGVNLRKTDAPLELIEKALAIYKGTFLAGDEWMPWAVSRRERLRSKFLLAVQRLCSDLTAEDQWEKAATYYYRSLDVDDLSEETYQGLMKCLQHLGRRTEALSVYKRCEKNLDATLGLSPSPKTQAIYSTLVDGN